MQGGELYGTIGIFGSVRTVEYWFGYLVYFGFSLGGSAGAAIATVIAMRCIGIGITIYVLWKCPSLRVGKRHLYLDKASVKEISQYSFFDLYPTICYEFWNFDGTRTSKQLLVLLLWRHLRQR